MPQTMNSDPRANVYHFGSVGSPQNHNILKIKYLLNTSLKSGSLWITFL